MNIKEIRKYLYKLSENLDIEFGIVDAKDTILVSSDKDKEGNKLKSRLKYLFSEEIMEENVRIYIEKDSNAKAIMFLISDNLNKRVKKSDSKKNLKNYCLGKENVIIDKEINSGWVVVLIKAETYAGVDLERIVKNIFPSSFDEVFADDEKSVIIVKKIEGDEEWLDNILDDLVSTLTEEYITKIVVSVSEEGKKYSELNKAYGKCLDMLYLRELLGIDNQIIKYDDMYLERLLSLVPIDVRYIDKKYFDKEFRDCIEENISVIRGMMENNLNISESSRKMFMHRNSFIYRIDKIKKITGFDITNFEDALKLRIVMIVNKLER